MKSFQKDEIQFFNHFHHKLKEIDRFCCSTRIFKYLFRKFEIPNQGVTGVESSAAIRYDLMPTQKNTKTKTLKRSNVHTDTFKHQNPLGVVLTQKHLNEKLHRHLYAKTQAPYFY